ncbi:hypothetical protein GCM10010185_52110 [Saccharothrix coeruleofusca]|uniref:Uncharacterized protein n=1 Tax=Saccharothrix coeruleofusca TaxID=33919 RepID=A0A918EF89_9PSEU|nr:hypothetical protein GCM10010185_52110 [Saccharothrix coeruleofusca]
MVTAELRRVVLRSTFPRGKWRIPPTRRDLRSAPVPDLVNRASARPRPTGCGTDPVPGAVEYAIRFWTCETDG